MMDRVWYQHYEQGVPPALTYPDRTLNDLLIDSVRRQPRRIATNYVLKYVADGKAPIGGQITYQKLERYVASFANALKHLGVQKGDRVIVNLPNTPQYVIAFFGALRIGAIVVNSNPLYTAPELKHQIDDSGAETVITLDRNWPRLNEVMAQTNLKRAIVCRLYDTLRAPMKRLVMENFRKADPPPDIPLARSLYYFQGLLDNYAPLETPVEAKPDDVALLQYSGGTTGVPKAVMLTHRNLMSNNLQALTWMFKDQIGKTRERVFAAIPFFHVYGLQTTLLASMGSAAELVITPLPKPVIHLMTIIQNEKCSIFPGVPAMYIGIVNSPETPKFKLNSVKVCVSGSAPLPMAIQEKFGEITGGRLVEGFGMSETSPVTHINPIFGVRKAGSIGLPVPDTDAKIVDVDSGVSLPFDGVTRGELCVKGPQVMQGYWQRPDYTAETIDADGWLHTGDICTVDSDGYFFIVDRLKDLMIASGYKVLPREVEEVLFKHPKIADCAVAGVKNAARGDDTITAFVVVKPGETLTADEVKAFCQGELAAYKVPREVRFRDELPKTLVGKALRRQLVAEELKQNEVPA
jgi:long-chain acyl-CoA synthetase